MNGLRKRYFFILVGLLISSILWGKSVTLRAATEVETVVEQLSPGWNLGNTFDSIGGETAWGNPPVTKELIKAIKKEGYKSIRIPITWMGHFEADEDYRIDEDYFKRLDEVIQWSLDEDLYVVINIHHDSTQWIKYMNTDDTVLPKYEALWTQIAEHYKDYSDALYFESINEPVFEGVEEDEQITLLNQLNKSFFQIVRHSGGNNKTRKLILPTLETNDSQKRCDTLYEQIKELDDKNLIATIHYYGFWPFSVNIAGKTTFDEEVRTELCNAFDRVYNTFIKNDIPVICGEYGLLGFDQSFMTIEEGEVLKYFEYISYYAKEKDVVLMLWDNGQHFGRTKFTWSNEKLADLMKMSLNVRSSYGESDRIFIKNQEDVKDITMTLTLNGNHFTGVHDEERELIPDTDYSYDEKTSTITLKESYLKEVVTDTLGVNQQIYYEFDQGMDWNVDIITYDVPELMSMEGTVYSAEIPIDFHGDRLSTMEATYVDGGNAGPQDWTSYKQFDIAFKVDYEKNKIKLTEELFKETKDGDILLKFHFQSGNILEYTIRKTGDKVISISGDMNNVEISNNDEQNQVTKEESSVENDLSQENNAGEEMEEATESSDKEQKKPSIQTYIIFILIIVIFGFVLSAVYRRNVIENKENQKKKENKEDTSKK